MRYDFWLKQNWKDGEGWCRDAWSGELKRERIWQTYYDITAQWMHSQTGQSYTCHSTIWSDEVAKAPSKGDTMLAIIDPHDPQCCRVVAS